MERISKNFNAEYGINWDSIKDAINDEVAAVERDMERGAVPPGFEKKQTMKAEISSDSFVREEQKKRLERLFHIDDIQKHGSVNQPRCVQMFAKVIIEYLNEAYQQYQKEIFPSHTANVIDDANMHAMKELLQHGVSSQDLVKIILEYSPAEKIADLRGNSGQQIKDAMGIVLDAQREIEQGKGLEAGKEAAASL